jgi:hypothetical protein
LVNGSAQTRKVPGARAALRKRFSSSRNADRRDHHLVEIKELSARATVLLAKQVGELVVAVEMDFNRHSPDGRRFKVYSETASGFWQA